MAEKDRPKTKVERRELIKARHSSLSTDDIEFIPARSKVSFFEDDSPKRVVIYIRVSTDDEKQLTSFELQKSYYEDFVKNHPNWFLVKIYADEGISGTTTEKRDEFNKMIEDCKDPVNKINLVVVKSVSRFARNTVDSLTTIRKLKDIGCECYFEKENIWTFDGKGELLLTIMSSLAQEESRSISENVKWGHRKRFADGKVTVPFGHFLGYKRGEDGNLVIDEEQAVIVKRIYREYLSGSTAVAIAKGLTNDGIETPGHKQKWHASTVRSILTNEKYKGEALLQKYYTPDFLTKKQKVNNGEIQQYYVENNHPAIIEPEIFEMVRIEKDRRLMLNGKYSGTDILTSRIKCGECGGSYGAKVWHSSSKYKKVIYQCNRKYAGKEKCKTPAIRADDVETRFVNAVNSIIENKDEIISNLEMVLDKICNKKELSEEKEKLEKSLAEQVEKIQELIDMNSRVAQNQEKYKKEYDAMIKTYDETKFKYEQLEIESSQQAAKHQMIKDYINTLKKQNKPLTKFDGLMWGSLLESATIKDKDTIVFKFKDGTEING
ncbi:MAG: recombinase family protein [Sedimentibacter sp.]